MALSTRQQTGKRAEKHIRQLTKWLDNNNNQSHYGDW